MLQESSNIGLLRAAKNGNTPNVQSLLSKGASVDTTDEAGSTPLMLAAGLGHVLSVRCLVSAGADVNRTDGSGWTALSLVTENSFDEIVELLKPSK